MIRHALMTGILMVMCAAFAFAADFNGRWESTLNGPNGNMQLVFHFKVDGAKLTGSVETANGSIDIEEGKVDGDNISFKTHVGDSEVNHTGKISGDTIKLGVDGPWGHSDMALKRAEDTKK